MERQMELEEGEAREMFDEYTEKREQKEDKGSGSSNTVNGVKRYNGAGENPDSDDDSENKES